MAVRHLRLPPSPRHPARRGRFFSRGAILIAATLLTQSWTIASGDATQEHYSQRQISSYMQTVTSQLQLSKNWQSNVGSSPTGSLYCVSTLLGEGIRSGLHGLYTWFTCSAMHKLDLTTAPKYPLTCTGFSSAVWIQPGLNSISYQAISNGTEFADLKSSAPAEIQEALAASYNQVNKKVSRVVVGRAISGNTQTDKSLGQTSNCQ